MAAAKAYPGQEAKLPFTTEQVKALSAVTRGEIFWSFSPDEPKSAADIASETGKSAPSVHYHVQELAKVGLIIPASTRKRRSRTETLYVHGAKSYQSQGVIAPEEHRQYSQKTFAAMARGLANDNAALHRVADQHPEVADYYFLIRKGVRLRREQFQDLHRRMADLIAEFSANEDPNGVRVNVFAVVAPTMATIKGWAKRNRPA